ncbi:chromate transporter [Rhodobacteraceae bacterium WD3A24]|nr:chromate transporter [Rhodobacteraceae bacterium WD3A24]
MRERQGTAGEVFMAFLKLGMTSFGGPIAHLGYFREEFVVRREWLDDGGYADLVALCQFLPGPASSQVGFALGLMRAGAPGALAAWLAFTAPSAIMLILFAHGAALFSGPLGAGAIGGLKIVAVAIVAHAVWGMARSLAPDRARATIALGALLIALLIGGALAQVTAIAAGAAAGLALCRAPGGPVGGHLTIGVGRGAGLVALGLFAALLLGLPLVSTGQGPTVPDVADAFYRAGALVFGGGHVVLPLLEASVVRGGWIGPDAFISGYGAAQAIPGPLFTFSGYLGALLAPGMAGLGLAVLALVAIFLPGMLLLVGVLPFWDAFRTWPPAQALMRGANAAVVGILGAALYDPVFTSAVTGSESFALALTCFVLLAVWRMPAWSVVIVAALGGVAMGAG